MNRCKFDSPRLPTVNALDSCATIMINNMLLLPSFGNQYHLEPYNESQMPKHPSRIAVLTPEMTIYCKVIKRTGKKVNISVAGSILKDTKANMCDGIVNISQMQMLKAYMSVVVSMILQVCSIKMKSKAVTVCLTHRKRSLCNSMMFARSNGEATRL